MDVLAIVAVVGPLVSGLGLGIAGLYVGTRTERSRQRFELAKASQERRFRLDDDDRRELVSLLSTVNRACQQLTGPGSVMSPVNSGPAREARRERLQPLRTELEEHRARAAMHSAALCGVLEAFIDGFHGTLNSTMADAAESQAQMIKNREALEQLVAHIAASLRERSVPRGD